MSEKSDTATKEPEAQTKDSKTVTAKPEDIALKIEAALLTTDRPLPTGKLSEILGKVAGKSITGAIELLNKAYDKSKRSFRIEQVAGGWQVMQEYIANPGVVFICGFAAAMLLIVLLSLHGLSRWIGSCGCFDTDDRS